MASGFGRRMVFCSLHTMKKSVVLIAAVALLAGGLYLRSTAGKPADSLAAGVKPYPLDACIVSGEKLGSMGDPFVLVHEGQQVKFCCEHCRPKFDQEPAKYLAKLH